MLQFSTSHYSKINYVLSYGTLVPIEIANKDYILVFIINIYRHLRSYKLLFLKYHVRLKIPELG